MTKLEMVEVALTAIGPSSANTFASFIEKEFGVFVLDLRAQPTSGDGLAPTSLPTAWSNWSNRRRPAENLVAKQTESPFAACFQRRLSILTTRALVRTDPR